MVKKLTKAQLLKLLREHNWVKTDVARSVGVDEKTIRRWCDSHNINAEEERKMAIANTPIRKYSTSKASTGKKATEGTFVIVPDLHAHEVDWNYLATVCAFIKDFKPKVLIQLGDLMDYECLMSKRKMKYPSFDGKDIQSLDVEFKACANIISKLNNSAPKDCTKWFLKGNHEYRADIICKDFPEFTKLLSLEENLDFGDWKIFEYLDPEVKLGKLHIIHGEFYGSNHVQKHLKHYQKNVVYGHTHGIQQDTMASPMRKIPIWGASIGCGCNVNPDYQRNKSNAWQHGFAYGWWNEATGDFDVQIKRVINGKFWAEGTRYGV